MSLPLKEILCQYGQVTAKTSLVSGEKEGTSAQVSSHSKLTAGPPMKAREIFELVRKDLVQVEKIFEQQSVSSVKPITEIGNYLRASGGKRVRPAVLLLAAKLCGYQGSSVYQLAAVVELIHTATLVHDDIIDGADLRRGRPSTNLRWGNSMSVLAGDWLYMQSFRIALGERNFKVLDLLINLTQSMVEGEMKQLTLIRDEKVTEEQHLDLIYRKTACLFSSSMRLGAVLAGCNSTTEERMGDYGTHLGLAFQMIDDLLDFSSSPEKLGKPVGNDLREGKLTLPMILLLESCRPEEARRVSQVLRDGGFENVPLSEIQDLVAHYGTLNATRERARGYAERAKASLDSFPDSVYKQALLSLPDYILEREA